VQEVYTSSATKNRLLVRCFCYTKLLRFKVRFDVEDICWKNDRIEQNIESNNVLFETLFSMANIL